MVSFIIWEYFNVLKNKLNRSEEWSKLLCQQHDD